LRHHDRARHGDEQAPAGSARLDQTNRAAGILGQARGEYAAGGSTADHDVVEPLCDIQHPHLYSRRACLRGYDTRRQRVFSITNGGEVMREHLGKLDIKSVREGEGMIPMQLAVPA